MKSDDSVFDNIDVVIQVIIAEIRKIAERVGVLVFPMLNKYWVKFDICASLVTSVNKLAGPCLQVALSSHCTNGDAQLSPGMVVHRR